MDTQQPSGTGLLNTAGMIPLSQPPTLQASDPRMAQLTQLQNAYNVANPTLTQEQIDKIYSDAKSNVNNVQSSLGDLQYEPFKSNFTKQMEAQAKAQAQAQAQAQSQAQSSSGKVICTKLHELGMMPDYIYDYDKRYGEEMKQNSPKTMIGYHAWAIPLVRIMDEYTTVGRFMIRIIKSIALAWAYEMARSFDKKLKHPHFLSYLIGKGCIHIGTPICWLIGNLSGKK